LSGSPMHGVALLARRAAWRCRVRIDGLDNCRSPTQ
jgi:hypothetical protein